MSEASSTPSLPGPMVVGLGASAGGLEALQTFFDNMPPDAGLAYVIVTHQLANRASLLPLLLGRRTSMPVVEASDGLAVERDHVYVAVPGRNLALLNGRLHLFEFDDSAPRHLPIDFFFRSLAHDQKERAIGVVLSGTGSDGTLGLKEIKAALGVSVVQSEADAGFSGMPHSAIYGDSPDIVLPAAELPERLLGYVRAVHDATTQITVDAAAIDALRHLFYLLQQNSGHDFSAYKQTTMRRRIERRMNLHRLASLVEYTKYVQSTPNELELLFDELLIGVTSFFRDPVAFEALEAAFVDYIAKKPEDYVVRVWVAGCSTGEEAYSMAILLRECLERLERDIRVQIFATDLDAKAIEHARTGFYSLGIASDVSPKRLKRFFVQQESGYQVRKDVREMLVFAPQNLIEDPPFTKLDLLSCRNLLIYLDASLQKRLFPIFHYVLKPGGLLLLGSSETLGTFAHLFEPVDKKWRLSRRHEVVDGTYVAELPASIPRELFSLGESAALPMTPRRTELASFQAVEKMLLRELVPPTVIMRERGDILHIHGRTGLFLEPAPGPQANANIFNMAREGLHLELAAAVRQAAREASEVVRRNIHLQSGGAEVRVDLRVKQLTEPEAFRGLYRVSFELQRSTSVPLSSATEQASTSESTSRAQELERALQYTKESHQGTIEELETANEELKSTNEELQSTNEELQSANEEMETSKEELQSLNEELQTVNVELQGNVEELSRANDDMTNLLNATDIATIFLDNDLNIKRHTAQAQRVIRLIPSDVGRSIGDLVSRLHYDQLIEDAREVLRTLAFKEVEVQGDGDHKWYLMRILPYRTVDNVIDGLVVTFVDITRVKLLQQSEQQVVHALQHSPVTVFGVDDKLSFSWSCSPVFGLEASAVVGRSFAQLFGETKDSLKQLIERAIESGSPCREQLSTSVRGRPCRFDLYIEPLASRGATCVAVQLD